MPVIAFKHLKVALIAGLLVFASCVTDDVDSRLDANQTEADPYSSAEFSDGSKPNPDDPYSLKNVQKAFDLISGERKTRSFMLQPTHHLVRFLPQSSGDGYILIDSLDLDLLPYPYFHDLSNEEINELVEKSNYEFTWQYGLVEADFEMPTEVMSELIDLVYYQTEEGEEDNSNARTRAYAAASPQLDGETYCDVMDKVMELTGRVTPKTRAAWPPNAWIGYRDTLKHETLPLANVRVVVTNVASVTFDDYTDATGWAHIRKSSGRGFTDNLKFHISWKKAGEWKIMNNNGTAVAVYNDPAGRRRSDWKYVIRDRNQVAMHAAIHRALQEYYHGNHPKAAGLVKFRGKLGSTNIRARWGEKDGKTMGTFNSTQLNQIHIFSYSDRGDFEIMDMYATTFHELGHGSHWRAVVDWSGMNRLDEYHNANIKETWAQGIQYIYTSSTHPNDYAKYMYYQPASEGTDHYTAIVESLMNQGFSLAELQRAMMGKTTLTQCKAAVKALGKSGVKSEVIDLIFAYALTPVRMDMSNLSISGPDAPALNTFVNYSVPDPDPFPQVEGQKISFYQFFITPDSGYTLYQYECNSSVVFTIPNTYTITAQYKFFDGATYNITKTVAVSLIPTVSADKSIAGLGESVTFTATGATSADVIYEWRVNGVISDLTGRTVSIPMNPAPGSLKMNVACRARLGSTGVVHGWSNEVSIHNVAVADTSMDKIPVGTNIRGWRFEIAVTYQNPIYMDRYCTFEVKCGNSLSDRYPLIRAALPNNVRLNTAVKNGEPVTSIPSQVDFGLFSSGWVVSDGFTFTVKDDMDYIVTRNDLPAGTLDAWGFDRVLVYRK